MFCLLSLHYQDLNMANPELYIWGIGFPNFLDPTIKEQLTLE